VAKVFISYERTGEVSAHRVADALRAAGHDVWTDAELPAHRAYSEVIEERLAESDAVVVLWSAAAEKSQWVRAEAEYARQRGNLVQVVLDDSLPPMPFNQTQCASLKGWNGDRRNSQWRKVLESLSQLSSMSGASDAAAPGGPGPAPPGPPLNRRRKVMALTGVLLALVVGGAWLAGDLRQRQLSLKDPRTVVLPFKALSADPAAREFAAVAASEFAGKLSESQIQTVTSSRAGQADFAITGTVQGANGMLHVRASLEDPHAGVTLWSAEFDRSSADAAGLRSEVGWRLNDVMTSAVLGRQNGRGRLGPAELGLFIQARDALAASDVESRPLVQELVRRAPDFALGHATMCMHLLGGARSASPTDLAAQRDAAVAECRRAAELDPQLGVPRRGLSNAEDGRQWARREALLRPGDAKSRDPELDAALGEFLGQTGRQNEGIRLLQAAAARKGWTIYSAALAYVLLTSDRREEASEFISKRLALRPEDSDMRLLNFLVVAFRRDPEAAFATLDDPARRPGLPPPATKAYRAFLEARRTRSAADRQTAIATILDTLGSISQLKPHAVAMLAELGAIDEAFRVTDEYSSDPSVVRYGFTMQPNFLFGPETVVMREDIRFIPIVKRLGLVDYWRTSGHWPDFCAQEPKSVCAEMRRQAGAG
jgi:TolB-like protein